MRLPPPLSWLWQGWKAVSQVIGRVMSFIILTVLWVIGFGAYGIVLKVIGLFKKEEPKRTYWVDLEPMAEDSLVHQF
jgi:hypothetical protein